MSVGPRAVVFTLVLAAACGDLGTNDPAIADVPAIAPEVVTPVPTGPACEPDDHVQAFFQARCGAGCHTDGASLGGVKLDADQILAGGHVLPGDPDGSAVVKAIASGEMPPGGQTVGDENIDALKAWIAGLECSTGGEGELAPNGLVVGCWKAASIPCNPLTNDGCRPAWGEACDLGFGETLRCQAEPNDVPAGGACDNRAGPFCQPGLRCGSDGFCSVYCCSNSDCDTSQRCVPAASKQGSLGACEAR